MADGSSPLARGTLLNVQTGSDPRRLIPARAGNTGGAAVGHSGRPAHPRSRGEHAFVDASDERLGGSSPLARGTHVETIALGSVVRLIPARAGNTYRARYSGWPVAAHPRSRGEHIGVILALFLGAGSSPLARGTRSAWYHGVVHARLIPARAGNTTVQIPAVGSSPAHPRSRGEHCIGHSCPCAPLGSSPLARGTHPLAGVLGVCERLIPARAGNTIVSVIGGVIGAAHPRSRGEHRSRHR